MSLRDRPRVNPAWQPIDRLFQAIGGLGFLTLLGLAVARGSALPSRVPLHFNAHGEPDRWGAMTVLLGCAVIGLLLFVGLSVLARYPRIYNYPWDITADNAERQYRLSRRMMLTLAAYVVWLFVWIFEGASRGAVGAPPDLSKWLLPVVIVVPLLTTGIYLVVASRDA